MANITVQRQKGGETRPALRSEVDPFRVMRDLLRWDPFRELAEGPFRGQEALTFVPEFDVKERRDAFVFTADLPGVKESDLEVHVEGNRLSISGKRESEKEERDDTYYTYERSFGSFSRSFTVPDSADTEAAKAELKNGVLNLVLPKKAGAMPKKIPVGSSGPGKA